MRVRAILLAAVLALAPLGARAADLVVWWEGEFFAGEDDAVREMMAAFEKITGKRVELVQYSQDDMPVRALTALEVGHPPDFLFGTTTDAYYSHWAHEGWLADIADALGPFTAQFDKDALERATLLDATTGRHGLYALPMARFTNHVHVWTSLLERAGFTLADVPKQWEPFWAFWCERVQPAVRRATGRDDLYGVGLAMSVEATDTGDQFRQFMDAYETDYVTRDGRLVIDEPEVRARLAKALDSYTAIWRKGCTPPASVDWDNRGNSRAFPRARGRDDAKPLAVDPERAPGHTAGGLLQGRGDDRVAGRRPRPAARDLHRVQRGRGLQGWRAHGDGRGVRALPGRRGLARALARLRGGSQPSADASAARGAVLARRG
jgi:ABC-type glycerol-3-phosphate transport system substrate-binding protein